MAIGLRMLVLLLLVRLEVTLSQKAADGQCDSDEQSQRLEKLNEDVERTFSGYDHFLENVPVQFWGTSEQLKQEIYEPKKQPQFHCSVRAQSYGGLPSRHHGHGFVELKGRRVWKAGWKTGFSNRRGISTMIVDVVACTASDIKQFDTWGSKGATLDLVAYLQWIREGAVILGVTGDEPTRYLSQALRTLKAAGVDVGDVQTHGNFVFVVQKGYPEKTMMVKSTIIEQPTSLLKVLIQGSSVNDLKFIRQ